jgi:hypothetical protein
MPSMQCLSAPHAWCFVLAAIAFGWSGLQLFWGRALTKRRGWVDRASEPGAFYGQVAIAALAGLIAVAYAYSPPC